LLVYPNWNDVYKLGAEIQQDPDKYKKIIFYPSTRRKYIYYLKDIKDDLIIEHADVIGAFITTKLWDMRYPKLYINLMNNDFMDLLIFRNIIPQFNIGKNIKSYGDYAKRFEIYLKEDHHKLNPYKNTIIIDRRYFLQSLLADPITYYGNFLEVANMDEFNKLKTHDLFEIIKDKDIYVTSIILNEYANSFKAMKDDPNKKDKLKEFVDMVRLKDELAFHINTLDKIVNKLKHNKEINKDSEFLNVLREFCLKPSEETKQTILKVFGYHHMFTFESLRKAGFIDKRSPIKYNIKKGSDLIFIGGITLDELQYFYEKGIDRVFTTSMIDCNAFLRMVMDA